MITTWLLVFTNEAIAIWLQIFTEMPLFFYFGVISFIVAYFFFSGPAVCYNPEFNKRIPVTGFGGLDLIITNNQELLSKM